MTSTPLDDVWPETIDLIVFDFDGVMTDNRVFVASDGTEMVACNRSDGLGIDRLRARGQRMIIVSTERNSVVAARGEKLQIPVYQDTRNKRLFLLNFLEREGIDPAHVAFVGNDVNDLECMKIIGLPVAVADAYPEILDVARLVLERKGGHGAVREFADRLCERYEAPNKTIQPVSETRKS